MIIDLIYLQGRREEIFKQNPKFKKFWNVINKKDAKADEETKKRSDFERKFLAKHIQKFFHALQTIPEKGITLT